MRRFPDVAHATLIAKTELRRAWRQFWEKGRLQQGVLGIAVLFGGLAVVGVAFGGYFAGSAIAADEVATPLDSAALVPAGIFTGVLLFTTYLTTVQLGDIDQRDALLTTVPHADVVGGIVGASFVRIGGLFVVPAVVGAGAFAVGVGSAPAFVLVVVSLALVMVSAYVLGFGVGMGLTHVFGRSALFVRFRWAIGSVAFIAYMWLVLANRIDDLLGPVVAVTRESPVAWFADLALLTVVDGTDPVHASVAALGGVVLVVGGVRFAVWVAGVHWYTDPVQTGGGSTESVTGGRLSSVIGRPAAWVATKSWLRARRAPLKLVYVAYPLFVLIQPIQGAVEAGRVTTTVPVIVAVYGAWATGAAFGLNPLGDEGAVLPITVTTGVGGRDVVLGLMAAGLVPGLLVTGVGTVVLGVASPLGVVAVAGLLVAVVVLCVGATAVATGIGVAFPRYEAAALGRSRSVVVPSTWGFLTYSVVLLVLAAPATAAQAPVVATWVGEFLGVGAAVVRVGGLVLTFVLLAPAAVVGWRHAVDVFDEYTVD